MPHDIFLSYASPDRAAADAVCAALEARGIRCWMAPRDVPAGADWGEAILTAIGRAHAMVLILSRATANSVHVKNEVVTAVSQSLALVPVRIEDCQPGGALRLHLAGSHWLSIFPPPFEQHADVLAAGVRLALAADATVEIPRAQAAAMVAAARAAHAAGGAGAQLAPPPPRPVLPVAQPRAARPPAVQPAAPAAARPVSSSSRRTAIILGLVAVLTVAALGAAAWMLEPRLRAMLGLAARLPAPSGVAAAEAAQPPDAAAGGLGSGAALPGLGGALSLPQTPLPAPPPVDAPRPLLPDVALPGLGGSLALPPGVTAPPLPVPAAPPIQPAPAAVTPAPPPSPATRIVNVASLTISRLYVAPAAQGIGRDDWLGNAQITAGNAVQIRAPSGQGCLFNIRAVYVGGRTEDRPGVDLCAAPELRFEGGKATGSSR